MIRPPRLARGDLVRVIAPGSHFDRERFNSGVRVLEQDLGLRVRWRDDVFAQHRFLAGDDSRRAGEFLEAFTDPDTRAVFCARGGYGSARILSHLDPTLLKAHPKILIGFSDITAVLLWLHTHTDVITFHGPMVTGRMSDGLSPEDRDALERTLMVAEPAGVVGTASQVFVDGEGEGRLVGGSLAILAAGIGTRYQPQTDGSIVFLEDIAERPYKLDRMLRQLEAAGLFQNVAALAFGEFIDCDNPHDPENSAEDILRDFAADLGVPCAFGFPFGHGENNRTIPLGARAKLSGDTLSVLEPAVS